MVFQLTRAQFIAKRQQLQQQGITLPEGDTGEVAHEGVTLEYAYTDPNLQVAVKHHPFALPEGMIEKRITGWFSA